MTMAGYPSHGGEIDWETKDPAPPAEEDDLESLRERVLDEEERMFNRMQAVFRLRSMKTETAIEAIGEAMKRPESSLLRHEAAYVLGQIADPHAIDDLEWTLENDDHAMVRHEAAEALGNINDDRVVPILKRFLDDPAPEVAESCEVALDNLAYLRSDQFEYE